MKKEYLEAGQITGIHSFKGEVKIVNFCDSIDFFKRIESFYLKDNGENEIKPDTVKMSKNKVIVKFFGIDTEEDARKITGKKIYFQKSGINLPDGSFFIDDLIGTEVFDEETKQKYGVLSEIIDTGAQQIFAVSADIENPEAKQLLIPNVKQFVKKISPGEGIFVELIDGMKE